MGDVFDGYSVGGILSQHLPRCVSDTYRERYACLQVAATQPRGNCLHEDIMDTILIDKYSSTSQKSCLGNSRSVCTLQIAG